MRAIRIATVQHDYAPILSSATGNLWLPDEPTAAEMHMLNPDADLSVRKLNEWPEVGSGTAGLISQNARILAEQTTLQLKQLLDNCMDIECDLVVLPEGSVPPTAIEVLRGYAQSFAIFAGIGRIREADLEGLAPLDVTNEQVHKNCALFIDGDQSTVVTKRRLAQGERANVGSGSAVVRWTRGDRSIGLGLSICKDYLADDDKFNDSDYPIDIVLISALTANTAEFVDKTPRHVRVFANHARFGGSTIGVPDLESLGLSDRNGVKPLAAGEQGIVVVDYTDFPKKPTSYQSSPNKLVRRSAVIYDDRVADASGNPSASDLVEALGDLNPRLLGSETTAAFLDSAGQVLARVKNEALNDAIRVIRLNQDTGTVTAPDLDGLTKHVILTDVRSVTEVRYAQLENAISLAARALSSSTETQGLGAYRDGLLAAKQTFLRSVRTRYRATSDRSGALVAGRGRAGDSSASQTFYGATLGQFTSDDAASSFPLQFDALRTLSRERNSRVALSYRLVTTRTVTSELVPLFEVKGTVENSDPGELEQLREGLGQLLGVAFASAWSVTGLAEAELEMPWRAQIVPGDGWRPIIMEDWAPVIDLLRAQQQPIELTMTCRAVDSVSTFNTPEAIHPSSRYFEDRFIDTHERLVGRYLSSLAGPVSRITEHSNLALAFNIGSQSELPSSLLTSIALRLLGNADFTIHEEPPTVPSEVLLKPSESLRVFHPPFGPLQGRGLRRAEPKFISLPSVPLPSTGSVLGISTLSSARADQDVSIRLDPESRLRHVYVIGKTGSGKTNLLKNLARQDIQAGAGVAVIDPHGDLVEHLLRHVDGREEEVTLLDFGDPAAVPVLNPIDLDVDPGKPGSQRLAIDDFISLLVRQSYHEWYGPRFEDTVRLALESLLSSRLTDTPTVLDISRVLRSVQQRSRLARSLSDPDLVDRWKNFEAQRVNELAELIHWTLAKFSDMDRDGVLGAVLGGGKSTVSITRVVQAGGVLLVRIPEWEIGPAASTFIGGLIQERLRRAAFDRISRSVDTPKPFFLYVDEFQKFSTSGFESMLAEARKFGLGLVLAHQNLRQLEEFSRFTGSSSPQLLESILGNVANMVSLGLSSRDASVLATDFALESHALSRVSRNTAVARLEFGRGEARSLSVRVPYAESDPGVPAGKRIRSRMIKEGIWRDRAEIDAYVSQNRLAVEGGSWGSSLDAVNPEMPGEHRTTRQSSTGDTDSDGGDPDLVSDDFTKNWLRMRARQRSTERTAQPPAVDEGDWL